MAEEFKFDENFNPGAFPDRPDDRDLQYAPLAMAMGVDKPFDWEKGYDFEKEFNTKVKIENQNGSSSCFPAGTKVLMEDLNYKDIEKIHIGERVVTHTGIPKKVYNTLKRKWQGTMFVIKGYGLFPIIVSPEHPFLLDNNEWVEAKGLQKGMYLTIPKTNKIKKDKLDYEFELDDNFLWAIGFYLAEGSVSDYGVHFSIHQDEVDYQNRLEKIFGGLGTNVSISDKKNTLSRTVSILGKIWAERFLDYGSKLCFNKKLHKKFLTLEPKKQLNILRGWMDGDGCYKQDCYIGVTTSKELVRQMNDIAKRNGIRTAIRKRKKEENKLQVYELQFGRDASKKLLGKVDIKYKSQYGYEDEKNFYIKIDLIDKILSYAGGHIYNIEVEKDNSYIVETVAVHNCVGQATSSIGDLLNFIETKKWKDFSAKGVYEQIYLPSGGAYTREACKIAVKYGFNLEEDLPSYTTVEMSDGRIVYNGPTEKFMTEQKIDDELRSKAEKYKSLRYFSVPKTIDDVAIALRNHKTLLMAAKGGNDCWNKPDVEPGALNWGHAFYGIGALMRNGKKAIKFANSWSTNWGDKGYGYLNEDYFKSGNVYTSWVLIDQKNIKIKNMIETIQKKGKPEIFAKSNTSNKIRWVGGWESYQQMLTDGWIKPFVTVDSLDEYEIDWHPFGFLK